jgi:hypothetical protein
MAIPYKKHLFYGFLSKGDDPAMAMLKKTVALDQDAIDRIKTALNVKTEKEAINRVLREFDTDILLADITFKDAGSLDFETVFED